MLDSICDSVASEQELRRARGKQSQARPDGKPLNHIDYDSSSEAQSELSIIVSASNRRIYDDASVQLFEGGTNHELQGQPNQQSSLLRNNLGDKQQKQMHPLLSLAMLALAMVILTAIAFSTKVMIKYEGQNQMEAFYAINGFTLLIFTGILIVKIKIQGRQLNNHRQAEIDDLQSKIEAQDRILSQNKNATIQEEDTDKKTMKQLQRLRDKLNTLQNMPQGFISLEYNILKIAGEDTWKFFYIAVSLTVGIGFFFQAINQIEYRYMSNIILIIFGGLSPAVLAMRVKYWMVYTCGHQDQQFLPESNITKRSFVLDISMFVIALVGFVLILTAFSEQKIQSNDFWKVLDGQVKKDNIIAVCFCLISGVCIGLGLAEIRILCKFKELRANQKKQNYFFLKPLFWSLLTSQMIVPAFMYPSLASAGQQAHSYSGTKMLYFLVSAALVTIMLCGIGAALQHSKVTNPTLNLCMAAIPTLAMLLLDFLLINKKSTSSSIMQTNSKDSLIYTGFGLLVGPQLLMNLASVVYDSVAKFSDQ